MLENALVCAGCGYGLGVAFVTLLVFVESVRFSSTNKQQRISSLETLFICFGFLHWFLPMRRKCAFAMSNNNKWHEKKTLV